MNIIVVGIGKVGYTVCEQLAQEQHDVTVVDINKTALTEAMSSLDIIGINGNGASHRILAEAGVDDCDLLIALTGSDEVNLLCCLLASKMGAKGSIARVRSPEYNEDLELIRDNLGVSMTVNPEREAAAEIMRILDFPYAMNVDSFAKGKVDLVSFVAGRDCLLCGRQIKDSFADIKALALICAVERGEEVFIPSGDFTVETGDTVAVLAAPDEIPRFFGEIGVPAPGIGSLMIIGGGRITHYLAGALAKRSIKTTIIERDENIARNLSFTYPKANIICGDGTNRALLQEEGLSAADALCCLTGFDEENILLSLYAKNEVPGIKTITKVNKTAFQEVTRTLDIGSVIYPKYTTANLILQHVRARQSKMSSSVETLYKIIDNKVEALEFRVTGDSRLVGRTLGDLSLRKNVLIGCINRDGSVFIPRGQDALMPGDSVIVVTTIPGLTALDEIKEKR